MEAGQKHGFLTGAGIFVSEVRASTDLNIAGTTGSGVQLQYFIVISINHEMSNFRVS